MLFFFRTIKVFLLIAFIIIIIICWWELHLIPPHHNKKQCNRAFVHAPSVAGGRSNPMSRPMASFSYEVKRPLQETLSE
ncbi:hypothetical protein FKM82_015025 [Ascaphus truei]